MNDGKGDPPNIQSIQEYGTILFDILFGGEVRRLYDRAYRHRFRRLNVGFASYIPWINDFPWELAYDTGSQTFLTTSDVRFVRNVFSPMAADNIPPSNEPLRILIVSASHATWGAGVDVEHAEVRRSFQPLVDAGAVAIDAAARRSRFSTRGSVRARTTSSTSSATAPTRRRRSKTTGSRDGLPDLRGRKTPIATGRHALPQEHPAEPGHPPDVP